MSNTIIFNARILTMNEEMEIIKNGSILIEKNCIKEIRPGKIEMPDAENFDAEGMIVMPGFVNTHTHVPMTMLRGYADDLPLHTWLNDHIFPAEARMVTPENVVMATRLAFIEMIKSGTTCFNDMYFFEDIIAAEARKAGIRAVIGESLIDFPTPSFRTLDEGIARCESLVQQWYGHELIHPTVCAHSPYTCSKQTLRKAKDITEKYNIPLHIHVAETRQEVEDITTRTGLSPAAYLYSIGLLDRNVIAAHSVWLNPNDIELYARTGTSIAHCPKSNLKLASGIADTDAYLKAGINVGIGTDGTASNNTLDMVEETRFAALLPKGVHYNPEAVSAKTALRMSTINGAKALGLNHLTGSLEPGKRADLIVVHADASNMIPMYNEYSAIVYAANSKNIRSSMVNGKWIMLNREVMNIDKEETMNAMRRISETTV
ncbi:amidohydrolase family protein [Butyricimonas synergistica]|uniref:amidohydrolase family protein n=1 Tax=Butyricimonas synergistica TaxID=544644 RepID=UPI00058D3BEA|nr:amidohydrolase [Butyricimonas synergistica]